MCAMTPPQALDVARAWKGADRRGEWEAARETAAEVWMQKEKRVKRRARDRGNGVRGAARGCAGGGGGGVGGSGLSGTDFFSFFFCLVCV